MRYLQKLQYDVKIICIVVVLCDCHFFVMASYFLLWPFCIYELYTSHISENFCHWQELHCFLGYMLGWVKYFK